MSATELIFNIFQITTALLLAVLSWRAIAQNKNGKVFPGLAFFTFALVTLAVSDLYWLAYGLLCPDARMPFTASEIGECGSMLLFSAALSASLPKRSEKTPRAPMIAAIAAATVFSAGCTALWIGWNGSYITNILSGLAMAVLYASCLIALQKSGALRRPEWIAFGVWAFLLLALQGAIFFVPETVKAPLDVLCYLLIFSCPVFFLVRIVIGFARRIPAEKTAALSFSLFALLLCALYMSAGVIYIAAFVCLTLSLPLVYVGLRRMAGGKEAEE